MEKYYCYILQSIENPQLTYNGATTNLERRLRQHNNEITGGAKATKKSKWKYICIITGFTSWNECLACEWRIKHPTLKKQRPPKYSGPNGRIKTLELIFNDNKFTSNFFININNVYSISLDPELFNIITTIPINVVLNIL